MTYDDISKISYEKWAFKKNIYPVLFREAHLKLLANM